MLAAVRRQAEAWQLREAAGNAGAMRETTCTGRPRSGLAAKPLPVGGEGRTSPVVQGLKCALGWLLAPCALLASERLISGGRWELNVGSTACLRWPHKSTTPAPGWRGSSLCSGGQRAKYLMQIGPMPRSTEAAAFNARLQHKHRP